MGATDSSLEEFGEESLEESSVDMKNSGESKLELYVLELTENKYYVGLNFEGRITQKPCETGFDWAQQYNILGFWKKTIMNLSDEDIEVKRLMMLYGIDNVRGGTYSASVLTPEQIQSLEIEFAHVRGEYFDCADVSKISQESNMMKQEFVLEDSLNLSVLDDVESGDDSDYQEDGI